MGLQLNKFTVNDIVVIIKQRLTNKIAN